MQVVDGALPQHLVGHLVDELRAAGADHLGDGALLVRRVALLQLLGEDDLLCVHVRERHLEHDPFVDDVHGGPVGHRGDCRACDRLERVDEVERRAEQLARFEEEPLRLLGPLVVVDVGRRADPEVDRAVRTADRHRAAEMPAVRPVRCAEPVLDLEGLAGGERLRALRDRGGEVVGVHGERPAVLAGLLHGLAGVLEPAPVVVRRAAFAVGGPHDLRHRVRELAVAVLADPPLLGDVALPQELALALQLRGLPVQLDEDRDLRTKHLRVERLEEVVDGTRRVAAEHVLLLLRDRGQEDDRDRLRPLALLDQLCRVEPVETRHLDVEQDAREVVVEQRPERLLAGLRADEVLAERLEDRSQGDEVLLAVVDEQQVDDRLRAHVVCTRSPAGSHSRP